MSADLYVFAYRLLKWSNFCPVYLLREPCFSLSSNVMMYRLKSIHSLNKGLDVQIASGWMRHSLHRHVYFNAPACNLMHKTQIMCALTLCKTDMAHVLLIAG